MYNANENDVNKKSDIAGYLIVTRKKHQGIIINGNIEVSINKILPDAVSIGIKAPKSVKIVRKEKYGEEQSSS